MNFNKLSWCLVLLLFASGSVLFVQAQQDSTPPVLAGFDFSPKQVDTGSGPADITLTFHITDNLSGFGYVTTDFCSPSGLVCWRVDGSFVSGTPLDGMYQGTLHLPAFSESGTWTNPGIAAADKVGNYVNYTTAQLTSLGFPTTFTNVISTPYKAHVQPPINADDSSVFSAKRGVIPVKFTLFQDDFPTCALPKATISLSRTAGSVVGSIDEGAYLAPSDSGSDFRIDPTACQYIYNLAASSLGVGTYRVNISINGISVGNAVFALK